MGLLNPKPQGFLAVSPWPRVGRIKPQRAAKLGDHIIKHNSYERREEEECNKSGQDSLCGTSRSWNFCKKGGACCVLYLLQGGRNQSRVRKSGHMQMHIGHALTSGL